MNCQKLFCSAIAVLILLAVTCALADEAPNDTHFDEQWGLENTGQHLSYGSLTDPPQGEVDCADSADVQALEAWEITRASESILVAVLDTGVDSDHPDLQDNLLSGWNTIDNTDDTDPTALQSNADHGTKVAGIIAAVGNNDEGIIGVAPGARLVPYKAVAAGADSTHEDHIVAALDSCIQRQVNVINISHRFENDAGQYFLQVEQKLLEAIAAGITVVCSAGNDDTSRVYFPASMQGTIAVGASTMCDERKSTDSCDGNIYPTYFPGSNYGPELDLVAPGTVIRTTDPAIFGLPDYTWFFGTSSAAPIVSGVAALLLTLDESLSPAEVKTILCNTAEQVRPDLYTYDPVTGKSDEMGHGRLNAYYALRIGYDGSATLIEFLHAYAAINDGGSNPEYPLGDVEDASFTADTGVRQQLFTNGAIVYREGEAQAHWLGQGIWDAYLSLNDGDPVCSIGFPTSSEYAIGENKRVDCECGHIWWDGVTAHVVDYGRITDVYPYPNQMTTAKTCGQTNSELYCVNWTASYSIPGGTLVADLLPCETVYVDLYLNGAFVSRLIDGGSHPADAGIACFYLPSEDWQGQTLPGSNNYRIEVGTCDGNSHALSSPFSIVTLSIAPNIVEVHPGDVFLPTWTCSPNMTGTVSIKLVDGCRWDASSLAENVPAQQGSFLCEIPQDAEPGESYRLGIFKESSEIWAFSDETFTISSSVRAEFSASQTSGPAPLTVQFADLSPGEIFWREWDFNDDGIIDSNAPNPIYQYVSPGNYTVSLTVHWEFSSDIETKMDFIHVLGPDFYVSEPDTQTVWCLASDCEPAEGVFNTVRWSYPGLLEDLEIYLERDTLTLVHLLECSEGITTGQDSVEIVLPHEDDFGQPLPAADDYRIRITGCAGSFQSCSALFSIKWLAVDTPVDLAPGEEFVASWTHSHNMADAISIQLYNGCEWGPVLASSIPVTQLSVPCMIPPETVPGENYMLGIFNTGLDTVWDFSESCFGVSGDVVPKPETIHDLEIALIPSGILLSWTPPTRTVFGDSLEIGEFRVYKGTDPEFIVGPESYLGATADSFFVDPVDLELVARGFYRVVTAGE